MQNRDDYIEQITNMQKHINTLSALVGVAVEASKADTLTRKQQSGTHWKSPAMDALHNALMGAGYLSDKTETNTGAKQ